MRHDVVRRFVAAATSSSDRIGLQRTVGGGGETFGHRLRRTGTRRVYEVPSQLQSKLLIPILNERSKSLLAKLPKERLDK